MFGKKKKEEISHSPPGIQYKVVRFKEFSRISRESVISESNRIKKWSIVPDQIQQNNSPLSYNRCCHRNHTEQSVHNRLTFGVTNL